MRPRQPRNYNLISQWSRRTAPKRPRSSAAVASAVGGGYAYRDTISFAAAAAAAAAAVHYFLRHCHCRLLLSFLLRLAVCPLFPSFWQNTHNTIRARRAAPTIVWKSVKQSHLSPRNAYIAYTDNTHLASPARFMYTGSICKCFSPCPLSRLEHSCKKE